MRAHKMLWTARHGRSSLICRGSTGVGGETPLIGAARRAQPAFTAHRSNRNGASGGDLPLS